MSGRVELEVRVRGRGKVRVWVERKGGWRGVWS